MNRRVAITLLGGTAAWPLAARAQPVDRVRRVGMLLGALAADPAWLARVAAFVQGLQQSGWSEGSNLRLDTRWSTALPPTILSTRRT
jgi:putative tryptophan/tyrosine transport system substrate-binding protein